MDSPATPKKPSFWAQFSSLEAKKVGAILVAALLVYVGGWVFFYIILNWEEESVTSRYIEPGAVVSVSNNLLKTKENIQDTPLVIPEPAEEADPISQGPVEKKHQRQIPAGKTPPGVRIGGKVAAGKCWDNTGIQYAENDCSDMAGLFKLVEERLYLFDDCRKDVAGENLLGQLNLGIEFDLDREKISLWNTPASTLRSAPEVVTCIKSAIEGLSLVELEPLFNRYQYTFSVLFEGGRPRTGAKSKQKAASETEGSVHPRKTVEFPLGRFGDGRFVMVNRDRVRIRVEPVDGHMLGKISSGSRVFLLDQQEEWCQVRTRRGNVGWMVCWALDLK